MGYQTRCRAGEHTDKEQSMTWSMHPGQRYDEIQSRWRLAPPVSEGQRASVDAPTAEDLLGARRPGVADDAR